MSLTKQKVFPINLPIKINTILINNLEFDGDVRDIKLKSSNSNIEIDSPMKNILQSNINGLNFIIQRGSDFVIPFYFKSIGEYSGSLGKFTLLWKAGLDSFDHENIIHNETEINFPDVHVKRFDVGLEYDIPRTIHFSQEMAMQIFIKNNTEEFKRILFLIDTSTNFVTSGSVKKKLLLCPGESKTLTLPLIPIFYGKLKLPPFKIMEFPLASNSYDNKIYSVYYIPDAVNVNSKLE